MAAVFKKDTKEKNQKKAEAKKRKAEQQEQQEQQEPVDDSLVGVNAQNEPSAGANPDLQPGQLPMQQAAEPSLQGLQAEPGLQGLQAGPGLQGIQAEPGSQDMQAEPGLQAQPQVQHLTLEHDTSNQVDICPPKDFAAEPKTDESAATVDQHQPALS